MNTNQYQTKTKANVRQEPDRHSHHRQTDYRSAAPTQVETKGQRQRAKQYADSRRAEIEKVRSENPNAVKHRNYTQPPRGEKHALFILILVIFLCFSLSLLAVYGIATMVKNNSMPEDTHADTLPGIADNTTSADQQTSPDTGTTNGTGEQVQSVYASATPDTANISGAVLSSNAILIDLQSHTIIAQKGSGDRIYPASMTKIMTLLVAVENMTSLEQTATVTKQTTDYCYSEGASIAGFAAEETVTVEDLLYGTILPSGADATMTLAECIAGSEQEFVRLMNKKAAELGLVGTNFVNTSGLHHPQHYSTVHDIALILKAAVDNDTCFKILSASHYITSETPQHPTGIPLYSIVHTRTSSIKLRDMTIVGGKTGFTPEAGQCLSTYAITDDNREFILVTANASDKSIPISDAEYVYKTYALPKDENTDIAA